MSGPNLNPYDPTPWHAKTYTYCTSLHRVNVSRDVPACYVLRPCSSDRNDGSEDIFVRR